MCGRIYPTRAPLSPTKPNLHPKTKGIPQYFFSLKTKYQFPVIKQSALRYTVHHTCICYGKNGQYIFYFMLITGDEIWTNVPKTTSIVHMRSSHLHITILHASINKKYGVWHTYDSSTSKLVLMTRINNFEILKHERQET